MLRVIIVDLQERIFFRKISRRVVVNTLLLYFYDSYQQVLKMEGWAKFRCLRISLNPLVTTSLAPRFHANSLYGHKKVLDTLPILSLVV